MIFIALKLTAVLKIKSRLPPSRDLMMTRDQPPLPSLEVPTGARPHYTQHAQVM